MRPMSDGVVLAEVASRFFFLIYANGTIWLHIKPLHARGLVASPSASKRQHQHRKWLFDGAVWAVVCSYHNGIRQALY
jgi:hypothetical protein